jgi:(2Fe-2S) ferredoxin
LQEPYYSFKELCDKLETTIMIVSWATASMPPSAQDRWLIRVCQNRSCLRHGSHEVLEAFRQHQSAQIFVAESECMGQCSSGPTVRVLPDDTWYCRLRPVDVPKIVKEHLQEGKPVRSHLHPRFHSFEE